MKLLKIKAYQIFANYRKPMSFNFWDSYPLPPLSAVRGWFHTVVEAKEYIPMSMSIQGKFSSVVHDLQTLIKFDRKRNKEGEIVLKSFKNKVFSKSPTFVTNIYDIHLNIYIKAEEEYLKLFKENLLKNEYPSLGRKEDLIRIDYIDFIEPINKDFSEEEHIIDYGIYLNKETAVNLGIAGINYRMNFKYDKKLLDKTGLRYFEKKNVVYIDNDYIENGELLFDEEDKRVIDLIGY
ncbi:type I-B CRISPR-associated protein Cas5b [Nitrosophilus kaiyonis]|uniref:type I-B CRISPR-associated protein Cas5b n=1 Tax=Nitrosophilus kaiyonis TaxID=2930200 RepID=UPI0024906F3D|nr:type I-B CRISPR-associated protein Cas5b [Nitrosophilus kaiyonis]